MAVNLNNKSYGNKPFLGAQEYPQIYEAGKPWNYMSIDSVNANGDPLVITYWLGTVSEDSFTHARSVGEKKLQATKVITYDFNGNPATVTLY